MRNTPFIIPAGMPLTNRLDKLATEQAKWAIENGNAWIAYLKAQREVGVDVDRVEHKPIEAYEPPTPAERYQAICDILEKAWFLRQPCVSDGTQLELDVCKATELPDHDAELKNNARFRREAGETITSIKSESQDYRNMV